MRLAIIADSVDEGWPSMDLVAEQLAAAIERDLRHRARVDLIRLPIPRIAQRVAERRATRTIDRTLARYLAYPARLVGARYDAYHVADHSYAHLALALPAERTGVYVHDLDAFAPLRHGAPPHLRAFSRLALAGVKRASVAFYSTVQIADAVARGAEFATPMVHAPYGVAAEFTPDGDEGAVFVPAGARYVLHVGSGLPRKRIDVLLHAFAHLWRADPTLRLVQRGAPLREHRETIRDLGIAGAIIEAPPLDRNQLAALYRGAAVVMQSSDSEGFGLPVLEALACGAPLATTDILAFREVGGSVIETAPAGDPARLANAGARAIAAGRAEPEIRARTAHARRFSWAAHAETIVGTYERVLEREVT